MASATVNTADAVRDTTLTIRMHTPGGFRARLWLATALLWLAGRVIGMKVDCEVIKSDE
jgi:hypothetical protein